MFTTKVIVLAVLLCGLYCLLLVPVLQCVHKERSCAMCPNAPTFDRAAGWPSVVLPSQFAIENMQTNPWPVDAC